jgi:ring-1,2-phenylacetyl-CoA epoxidase subunit PaaC
MKRDVRSFKNVILVERPNGHWGDTIMRQFMFDCFHYYLLDGLTSSGDQRLSSIAKKSIKEASYHLSFSSEWVIRLGDGTDESHQKMQESLNDAMPYFEEMFLPVEFELKCQALGIAPDLSEIRKFAVQKFEETIHTATLIMPENKAFQKGGKTGLHSEHLGHILAELQFMQRAYPNATW